MPSNANTPVMGNHGLVVESPGQVHLMDLPLPLPGLGEVRVRVRYVALCGSDKKLYEGSYHAPHKYPIVIGHEWVGEIEAMGEGCVGNWAIGDIVTGDCSLYCGECYYCATNRNHCTSVQKRGITVDGACAQHIVLNARHLYHCPESTDLRAFVLSEPLAVSVHAVGSRFSRDDLKTVRKALVIGAGGIGTLSLFTLADYGISDVTIVDISREKLTIAESLGFPGVRAALSDLSDLEDGTFDLILEASGNGAALRRTVELAAPNARIVCIGHQGSLEMDFGLVMKKSLTISASMGSTGGFEGAIGIIAKYPSEVSKIITRVVPLASAARYFQESGPSSSDLKVLIDLH